MVSRRSGRPHRLATPFLLLLPLLLNPSAFERRAHATEADPAAEARLEAELDERVSAWDWRGTLATADDAIESRPDSLVAWRYRAYALHQLGNVSQAVAAYEKAIAIDPLNAWAHMNLAELLTRERRFKEAVRAASRAVDIEPASVEAQAKLSLAHRESGAYASAVRAVETAIEKGANAAWCHAELGYLKWVLEETDASRAHWSKAREAGFDAEACAHGLRLAEWDAAPHAASSDREELSRRRLGAGPEWVFGIGKIEVHTRVGPALPREIEKTIEKIQRDYAAFLGVEGQWTETVRLHVARTVEQHEDVRQREFPQGYRGKAFLERRPNRFGPPSRRFPRARENDEDEANRGGERWRLDIYVAYSEADFVRSLSHELAHAILHVRVPRSMDTPVWFDEGIATYLELHPDASGHLVSGALRVDLLAEIADALEFGALLGWRDMLFADRRRFEGRDARARYAEAWAMVHFLVEGRSDGRARLRRFIDQLETPSRDRKSAFTAAWGVRDLDALEREFASWLAKATPR